MAGPSYASALANSPRPSGSSTAMVNSTGFKSSLASQIEELSQPTPQSMTLVATLQLLSNLEQPRGDVFLISRSYLQNWLIWAYHQKVSKRESSRVEGAVRLAAVHLGLEVPHLDMEYVDPGPVDVTNLSVEGHPLLLKPKVVVVDRSTDFGSLTVSPANPKDVSDFRAEKKVDDKELSSDTNTIDFKDNSHLCCAVSESFYETIRCVHGVVCDDGFSVSFQPYQKPESEELLHHHSQARPTGASDKARKQQQQKYDDLTNGVGWELPKPIEFRRKVLMKPAPRKKFAGSLSNGSASPMTKLLQEEEKLSQPQLAPVVEVYPLKLNYKVSDGFSPNPKKGFVLVSRRTRVYDALKSLMDVTASKTASSCKRVWSKRINGTETGDDYEVIDLEALDGKLLRKEGTEFKETPKLLIGEWISTYGDVDSINEIEVLVEIKRPNAKWPRAALELENRIQVGDFVDAQDVTGKWFEALVKEVDEDTITVHYFGWASKWNSTIRRRKDSSVPPHSVRVRAAAPLWTHTKRWREKLEVGKVVEVRDASSISERPKWYKGIVKRIGPSNSKPKPIEGGAELEMFLDEKSGKKKPLLLMHKTMQVIIEVAQELERDENPKIKAITDKMKYASIRGNDDDDLEIQPPYIRWVNLYGEEICEPGTHMKLNSEKDPAVVTLQYVVEAHRKPVEVLKSWNNMYGQGFMKESLMGQPPAPGSVGMHNLGNSCFLNSIIQCLNHIEPITQYFLKGDYSNDLNRKNPLGSGGRVATAYAALLKEIWSGKYSSLAPRLLKQTVASFAPQFNNSYQHDSQEFCQFLMDGIHEDCNRVKSKPYVEELEGFGMEDGKAAIETWRKHLLRHDSVIVDFCQGMHRSHLTCPSCGRESIKFDVFSTLSLPIGQDKNVSSINLEDCIEKFMEGEQLDDMNAWYCPGCKKHVCALKMIALWSVPDILIVHLKRFQFDHCSVSNQVVRSKIDATVKFPVEGLDMRKHVLGPIDEDAPPVYRLFGVSEHQGSTANSGHYTATVRNSRDGRWYRYNDAHVGETTGDAAVTGGAYLLFFQREKGTAKWAGLEKVMKERGIDPYGGLETDQEGFTTVKAGKKKKT